MHILYDTGVDLSGTGGAVTHIVEKASALARSGVTLEIWTSGKKPSHCPDRITFKQFGIAVVNKQYKRYFQYFIYELSAMLAVLFFKNTTNTVILARQRIFGLGVLICAKIKKIPVIYEVNDWIPDQMRLAGKLNLFKKIFINLLLYSAARKSNRILALTFDIKEMCVDKYNIEKSLIDVIPVGCNTELFKPMDSITCKKDLKLDPQKRYLLNVSTFTPWAGIDFILTVMKPLLQNDPSLNLLLVGKGVTRNSLEKLVHDMKIEDRVVFTGAIPYLSVPVYIGASDACFCVKSEELLTTSPTRLFEYLSCGKSVFVTPGYKRTVPCDALIELSSRDISNARSCINNFLNDFAKIESYSTIAYQYAIQNSSWEKVAERVMKVIDDLKLNK